VLKTQTLCTPVLVGATGAPQIELREWRPGDEVLLAEAGGRLSSASLYSRFLAGVPALPPAYLRMVTTAPRWRRDAQVALCGGQLIGWAEFARVGPECTEADLAVVVVDAWQRCGVGTALVSSLVSRCRGAGVSVLSADVAPYNRAARAALRSWFERRSAPGSITVTLTDGLLRYVMRL
jgi:GNAT superfamily N-acetyltransferase